MVRWLSRFFNYLDRYFIQRHNLHPLNDVGLLVFRGESTVCRVKGVAWHGVFVLCGTGSGGEGDWLHAQLRCWRCSWAGHVRHVHLPPCFSPLSSLPSPLFPAPCPVSTHNLLLLRAPDHVYTEIKRASKDSMLKLIESEREGEQIDRSLLKNVLAIFQEVRGWVGQPYVTGGIG
jgi:hypothetical protein